MSFPILQASKKCSSRKFLAVSGTYCSHSVISRLLKEKGNTVCLLLCPALQIEAKVLLLLLTSQYHDHQHHVGDVSAFLQEADAQSLSPACTMHQTETSLHRETAVGCWTLRSWMFLCFIRRIRTCHHWNDASC